MSLLRWCFQFVTAWLEGLGTANRCWVIAAALIHTFIPVAKHKVGKKHPLPENETHKDAMICLWLQVWLVCFYPSAWHSRCFESGAWEADKTWKSRCEVLLVHACGKMLPWEMSPGSKPGQGSCCVYPEACEAMRGSLTHTHISQGVVTAVSAVSQHSQSSNDLIPSGVRNEEEGVKGKRWCENVVFCCSGQKGHADGFLIPMLVESAPTFLLLSHGLSSQDTHM